MDNFKYLFIQKINIFFIIKSIINHQLMICFLMYFLFISHSDDMSVVNLSNQDGDEIDDINTNTATGLDTDTDEDKIYRDIPTDFGGGGIIWKSVSASDVDLTMLVYPGPHGGGGLNLGGEPAAAASRLGGSAGRGGMVSGGGGMDGTVRAAAVAGAMLGLLAAVMSVVWAVYGYKPGVLVRGPARGGFRGGRGLQEHGSLETYQLSGTVVCLYDYR